MVDQEVIASLLPQVVKIVEALRYSSLITDNYSLLTVSAKRSPGGIPRGDDGATLAEKVQLGVEVPHTANTVSCV